MPQKKAELEIGHRAAYETRRLFDRVKDATGAIGCNRKAINEWEHGSAPSTIYLARMHELGADVIWILTGKHGT
jgi:hypothetical protein